MASQSSIVSVPTLRCFPILRRSRKAQREVVVALPKQVFCWNISQNNESKLLIPDVALTDFSSIIQFDCHGLVAQF